MREEIKESLWLYYNSRVPTGGFLQAVLENNLIEAFARADEDNQSSMFEIVKYVYNELPLICYGSPAKVKKWLNGLQITAVDLGRWVTYTDDTGQIQRGRLKSFDAVHAFVVFHCNDDWDNYQNYTAQAVAREALNYDTD